MVGCDNSECPIEWFHFGCVGLETKPKGKWVAYSATALPARQRSVNSAPPADIRRAAAAAIAAVRLLLLGGGTARHRSAYTSFLIVYVEILLGESCATTAGGRSRLYFAARRQALPTSLNLIRRRP
uniref:Zinc finger PHD-type domain-containing protein n=1 Tax=Plectus sambesii TaxID=2011161 RepID=A0A914UWF7_9BILA